MRRHLLLTGCTGFLGQYLLRDLLAAGHPVAVLVRPTRDESSQARLERVLENGDRNNDQDVPPLLEGDVTEEGLGLSEEDVRWISRNCKQVLHCAASLTFHGSDRLRDPWRTNLTGVGHLLDLCRKTGLRQLHYVSTAYTCGERGKDEVVREVEHDYGQTFRNDYENSKFEAEKLVRGADFLDRLTVYRPAVIVGDSRTGFTSSYHGLYAYFHFVWILRRYLKTEGNARWHLPIRLNLTGDEARNLIPVEWVSAVITDILRQPRHHGRTYHLTPTQPITARQLEVAMSGYFHFHGTSFLGSSTLPNDMNEIETRFYEHIDTYASYWNIDPVFDSSNTRAAVPHLPCPRIDEAVLARLIDFAVQDCWGKKRLSRMAVS